MKKYLFALPLIGAPILGLAISCGSEIKDPEPYKRNGKIFLDKDKMHIVLERHDVALLDKSFNQQLAEAVAEIKGVNLNTIKANKPAKTNASDQKQALSNIPKGSTIISSGFGFSSVFSDAKEEIDGKNIIYVDGKVSNRKNIASVEYDTTKSSFLGGYSLIKKILTERTTTLFDKLKGSDEKLKISVFGGQSIKPINDFMGSFKQGIDYALKTITPTNSVDKRKIEFYVNPKNKDAFHYSGGYSPGGGTNVSKSLINENVDIIFPVAGPQTEDLLKVIKEKNSSTWVIGIDVNQENIYKAGFGNQTLALNRILFSIVKNVKKSILNIYHKVQETPNKNIHSSIKGIGEHTVGNLENELVGISNGKDSSNNLINNAMDLSTIYDNAKNDQTIKDYINKTKLGVFA